MREIENGLFLSPFHRGVQTSGGTEITTKIAYRKRINY